MTPKEAHITLNPGLGDVSSVPRVTGTVYAGAASESDFHPLTHMVLAICVLL
jgi:hypothetical protein